MLTIIAKLSSNNNIGTVKDKVKISFVIKVATVDSHISFDECLPSDSSDICMPKASDIPSAIAMIMMPPRTARTECVLELSPTIKPMVVIIAVVRPKLNPVFMECFISHLSQQPHHHCFLHMHTIFCLSEDD